MVDRQHKSGSNKSTVAETQSGVRLDPKGSDNSVAMSLRRWNLEVDA